MKKKITAILLVVALAVTLGLVPAASVGANPAPAIVGLWHFDNNADDSSGNSLDGAEQGNPEYVSGMFDMALSLDGDGDYVQVDDDDLLDITGDLTIEAWVKLDSVTPSLSYVVAKDKSGERSYGLFVDGRAGHDGVAGFIVFKEGGVNSTVRGDTILNTGQWYHLAGTYDYVADGTSEMKIYVDGSLDSTAVIDAVGPIKSGSANLQIGAREYVGHRQFFDGLIDEVRIWDEAVVSATLYAGQTIPVGSVGVWNDGTSLHVTYQTMGGWVMTETHLDIVTDPDDFPTTKKGNPKVGHFAYSDPHGPVPEYTYQIALSSLSGDSLYIAAQADVVIFDIEEVVDEETAWGYGTRFTERGNWATWFTYHVQEENGNGGGGGDGNG